MVNRITGFSGSIDVDGTVKKLMDAERIPLNKLYQQRQVLDWQTSQYRDMNSLLDDFRQSIFSGVGMQSSFMAKAVTSTNDSIVSAKANGVNVNPINTIDSITTLASSAKWIGGVVNNNTGQAIDADAKLNTYGFGVANYQLPANNQGLNFNVTNPDGTKVAVNIQVDSSKDSLNDVLNRINSSAIGVSAFYDSTTQKLVFTSKNTGAGGSVAVDTTKDTNTADFMTALGFNVDASNVITPTTSGIDASFSINGLATTRKTNTFTISNITYSLKQTTATPITISSSSDTDTIFNTVKSFVDKYNDVIGKVNGKMSETRYRDYSPLTDDQKSAMKDTDIANWNAKAQSGLIRNDSILTSALTSMRTSLFTPVSNPASSSSIKLLSDIGITTSSDYLANGKLEIDETKLKKAIQNDPNGVANLFTSTGSTDDQNGLAVRLKNMLQSTIKNVALKAGKATSTPTGYSLGKNLIDLNSRISAFEDRLKGTEDRYYRQFNAMEQAVSKSNQQISSLMSKLGQ
jgi:flagellar hook-associated protein 2